MKIALLGAESTGKTTLSQAMATALQRPGRRVAVVPEVLREWCLREGRAPRPDESEQIAREQERRVDEAAAGAHIVVADTTALLVAIYGALLFPEHPLLRFALERQRGYDLTLVTGLDLPWVGDGLHRESQAREPIDAQLRTLLAGAGVPFHVVYGSGDARTRHALAPVLAKLGERPQGEPGPRWTWSCDKCSDPECEHRLFTRLRDPGA